jgi:hypothetical protein
VKSYFIIAAFCFLSVSCDRKQENAVVPANGLKAFTARVIDSIADVIDSSVSMQLLKEDSTFKQFISSASKRRVRNFAFPDSLGMVYYIEKCGPYCLRLRRSYFKDGQLIKVSFGIAQSLSLRRLGDYYYSKEKAFLLTSSSRQLPKPDSALAQAKRHRNVLYKL